jgi:hypothetical protein
MAILFEFMYFESTCLKNIVTLVPGTFCM